MVITIMAVVASLGATLVSRIVAGQQDTRERLTLAASADATLSRLNDDLQKALPNSLRVTSGAGGVWIEWVPVREAGRFRSAPDTASGTPGDLLDLGDAADASFDIIGTALGAVAADSQLVLHNLGTPEADVYQGNNRRAGVVLGGGGTAIGFTAGGALPTITASQRFFLVGTPVSVACLPAAGGGHALWRYQGYAFSATQPDASTSPALAGATTVLLLGGLSDCAAAYSSALANMGLLTVRLSLGSGHAAMTLLHQVAVDNTP